MLRKKEVMHKDIYNRILDNIARKLFVCCYFSTGEPLLNTQFGSLLRTTSKHSIFSLISTNLSIRLNADRIDDILTSGLGLIVASIDGATPETYSQYRRGGDFNLVLENVAALVARKRELGIQYPLIEWRFLVFRHNQHEIDEARAMASRLGVDLLEFWPGSAPQNPEPGMVAAATISPSNPISGLAFESGLRRNDQFLTSYLRKNKPKPFNPQPGDNTEKKCDWLYFSTMVYPNGAIGPCCVAEDEATDFTNITKHNDLVSALNSDKHIKSRQMFSAGVTSGTICDQCPISAAQDHQFQQTFKAILRNAPGWVINSLNASPQEYFFEIDRALCPEEIGVLFENHIPRDDAIDEAIERLSFAAHHQLPQKDYILQFIRTLKEIGNGADGKLCSNERALIGNRVPNVEARLAMGDKNREEPLSSLSRFPQDDGVVQISPPRRFAHDESSWDEQAPPGRHVGRGLARLIELQGGDLSGPALEIGCGTGSMTVGLCESGLYPMNLITDPSPVFVRMARNALIKAGLNLDRSRFGILMAEDIGLLPAETFSLVAMRYTLHHIADVDRLFKAVSRVLKSGGIFAFEEPCWEGYVLMGAIAQFLPAVARADGVRLTEEQTNKLTLFTDTMRYYARRDVDKSQAEDKHLFRVDEIIHLGMQCGMEVAFVSNYHYEQFSGVTNWPICNGHNFTRFFHDYLKNCMGFDEALVRLFDHYLAPYCKYIEDLSGNDNGPYMHGLFCCRKTPQ